MCSLLDTHIQQGISEQDLWFKAKYDIAHRVEDAIKQLHYLKSQVVESRRLPPCLDVETLDREPSLKKRATMQR